MIQTFIVNAHKRHLDGEKKYGKWTYNTKTVNEWIDEALQEKYDCFNYLHYLLKKLRNIKHIMESDYLNPIIEELELIQNKEALYGSRLLIIKEKLIRHH